MIIPHLPNHDYRIIFHHDPHNVVPRCTTCQIEKVAKGGRFKTDGEVVALGTAICSEIDNFNKAYGRQLSMKRAMKKLQLPKDQKEIIWGQFL